MEEPQPKRDSTPAGRENPWLNLGFNILVPILLLTKGDDWFGFSPAVNLCVALAFPLGYGIYDFFARRKFNFFSVLGIISVVLTGGIGLLQLPNEWIAIKEAAIPLVIGLLVVVSQYTPMPLVRNLLLNPELVDLKRIDEAIDREEARPAFRSLIQTSTWLVAASFFVSAVLNYVLARVVVTSPSGTPEFNEELGRMQGLSYIVIFIPSMAIMIVALFRLYNGISRLTGLSWEDFIRGSSADAREKSP